MSRTLTQQVMLAAIMFIVVLGIAAAITANGLVMISETTHEFSDQVLPQVHASGDFHTAMTRALGELESAARSGVGLELADAREALTEAQAALLILNPTATTVLQTTLYQQQSTLLHETTTLLEAAESQGAEPHPELLDKIVQLQDSLTTMQEDADVLNDDRAAAATVSVRLAIQRTAYSMAVTFGLMLLLALLAVFLLRNRIVRPLNTLAAATAALADRHANHEVMVTSSDEIGALQTAFNTMGATLRAQTLNLEQQVTDATTTRREIEAARAALTTQLATIESQGDIIREMSVPILPLTSNILVMPLVGTLDAARLHTVQEQSLRAIEQSSAGYLIMDITGVPLVDSQVAQGLLHVVQATRLLGAEVVLVGVRPEVAQSLIGLGLHFDGIIAHSSLQQGIAYAIGRSERVLLAG